MNTQPGYAQRRSMYTPAQRQTIDAIGSALKHRRIDFKAATKLRDLVRLGRLDEALERLRRHRQTPGR